jgi:glycosyltransferase involved in cell wall biosynthesis
MNNNSKNLIICFPGTLYDKRPFTNRQRVMQELNKQGNKVIYVEPPKNLIVQLIKLILRVKKEQKTQKWFKRILKGEERKTNLYIFSQIKFVGIKHKLFRKVNNKINSFFLKRYIKKIDFEKKNIWIYTPDAVDYIPWLKGNQVIYDCVDEYAAQPWYINNFYGIQKDEDEILSKADIVFTSSEKLFENKKRKNPNTFLMENVADFNHFNKLYNKEIKPPSDLGKLKNPIIGFVGALDRYKLDFELLIFLAKSKPYWNFVLIGPHSEAEKNTKLETLRECENIHLLGPKAFEELPKYVMNFDVCIIPYAENEYTKGCFPLKLFEYYACGKPVVIKGLPSLNKYANYGLIANTNEEFMEKIDNYLNNDSLADITKRIALSKENTWESKAEKMSLIINKE